MADSKADFQAGTKARELLVYTYKATRPASEDIARTSVRTIFQRVAGLDDIAQMQKAIGQCLSVLDRKDKGGFSKSAYNLWGKDMRGIATDILRGVHGANNRYFATEYDTRLRQLRGVLDNCSLLLEYIQVCEEAGILSIKKAGEWAAKVWDVKKLAGKWLKTDSERAEKLRKDASRRQAELSRQAFLAALQDWDAQRAARRAPPK